MKLAQALLERSDLQKRIAQLRNRLIQNAKVQEGESPAESPQQLLQELEEDCRALEQLITKINLTNAQPLDNGECLTALLAKREVAAQQVETLRYFLAEASSTVMRGTRTEVIVKSTVSVRDLQKEVDERSRILRELDIHIQECNWNTDLLD